MGEIEFNKLTRKVSEIEAIPDDNIPAKLYFDRVAQRLGVCLIREEGVFPERTAFDS
ncbi:hypothetical protein [Bacillus safensis]|uniref:hypothetical protein n=1 Tax=Bacillus safensis TaxID=561879 RepID=UPI0018E18F8E|nr:hypothetical protein [Bacillus safensis]MBI1630516.1 hypothetical protein [Bacillus safensis]